MVDLNLLMSTTMYGGILALLALGITLIYMTTKVFNFAHARLSLVGAYAAATAMALYVEHAGIKPSLAGTPAPGGVVVSPYPASVYALGIMASAIGGMTAALIEYYVILKPLLRRGADYLKLMIATLAYDFFLTAALLLYDTHSWVTATLREGLNILATKMDMSSYDFTYIVGGRVYVTGGFILSVATAALVAATLYFLLYKTTLGIKMRASVENPPLAESLGVDVERIYSISWIISGITAGAAGFIILLEPIGGGLKPVSATSPADEIVVSAFASSIVGGVNSIFGSIFGGFFVGYVETYVTDWLGALLNVRDIYMYNRVVSMAVVALTLLFAPRGVIAFMRGRKFAERLSRGLWFRVRRR